MIPEQISDDTGTRMVKKFKGTCIKWAEENPDCLKRRRRYGSFLISKLLFIVKFRAFYITKVSVEVNISIH